MTGLFAFGMTTWIKTVEEELTDIYGEPIIDEYLGLWGTKEGIWFIKMKEDRWHFLAKSFGYDTRCLSTLQVTQFIRVIGDDLRKQLIDKSHKLPRYDIGTSSLPKWPTVTVLGPYQSYVSYGDDWCT